MGLAEDLKNEVAHIFGDKWARRDGNKVPESEDLKLGNDAVELEGTVLYADLSASTALVDAYKPHFPAEVYKAFLHCAAKMIRNEGGVVTAYDGDRVMGVFIGGSKNTNAARCALRINWARVHVINPAIKTQYPKATYQLSHVAGVDTSHLFVARTGVRGANDLVWVGRAANHAAKLTELPSEQASYITADVFDSMSADCKTSKDGRDMWEQRTWTATRRTIYRSNWTWGP
jgi:class 3 adenylate cyclase